MMMIDGANWVMFAYLIDDVFPIGLTNGVGCMFGTVYACIYLRNCWDDKREGVAKTAWSIFLGALCIILTMWTAAVTITLLSSRKTATDRLGYIVDFFTMLLYGSPLALAWQVLRTRSTSGMYLPLSLTIVAASALWSAYGLLTSDLFVVIPQSVGLFAGIAQLFLFLRFGVADNNKSAVPRNPSDTSADSELGGPAESDRRELSNDSGNGDPKQPSTKGKKVGKTNGAPSGAESGDQMRQPLL
ncbi:unnamed protein product [Sphacelaria rigidula]